MALDHGEQAVLSGFFACIPGGIHPTRMWLLVVRLSEISLIETSSAEVYSSGIPSSNLDPSPCLSECGSTAN